MPVLFSNKFQTIPTLTKRKIIESSGSLMIQRYSFWLPTLVTLHKTNIYPTWHNWKSLSTQKCVSGEWGNMWSIPGGGYLVVGTQIFDLPKPKLPDRFSGHVFVSSSLEIQFLEIQFQVRKTKVVSISMFFFRWLKRISNDSFHFQRWASLERKERAEIQANWCESHFEVSVAVLGPRIWSRSILGDVICFDNFDMFWLWFDTMWFLTILIWHVWDQLTLDG